MFARKDSSNKLVYTIKQNASLWGTWGLMSTNRLLESWGEYTGNSWREAILWSEWCWINSSFGKKRKEILEAGEKERDHCAFQRTQFDWGVLSFQWGLTCKGPELLFEKKKRTEIYFVLELTDYSKTKTHESWGI